MIKRGNRGWKIENMVFVERWRETIERIKNAKEEQRRPNILMINELGGEKSTWQKWCKKESFEATQGHIKSHQIA